MITQKKMEENIERKEKEREELINSQKEHIENADKFYFADEANPDSLFAKANMVKKYNDKNNK